jgi:hypothetical protein
LGHVTSGTKILLQILEEKETKPEQNPTLAVSKAPLISLDALQVLFTRLDTQCTQLGIRHGLSRTTVGTLGHGEPGFGPDIPHEFSSLYEARNSMDFLWNDVFRYDADVDFAGESHSSEEHGKKWHEFNLRVFQWKMAFDNMIQRRASGFNRSEYQASKILQVQELGLALVLGVPDSTDEMRWDEHTDTFAAINDLVAEVVLFETASFALNGQTVPNFSLDSEIVVPLFQVAQKCRCPRVRRQAIELLGSSPRQEGVWDGILVARVCQRMVEIEEAGLGQVLECRDVPFKARITDVGVDFDLEEQKAVMTYKRGGGTLKETIFW